MTEVFDGIISNDGWSKAKRRTLFLLKEAYSKKDEEDWSLPESIMAPEFKPKLIWRRVAFWVHGIESSTANAIAKIPNEKMTVDEVRRCMSMCAVVNLKKKNGTKTSNNDNLKSCVVENSQRLRGQIDRISPSIIVCGATWQAASEGGLWSEADVESAKPYDWVIKLKSGAYVLDFWHPSNQFPNVMNYYCAMAMLQEAGAFDGRK